MKAIIRELYKYEIFCIQHNMGQVAEIVSNAQDEINSLQAKIDELMLEYCPDDMTDDQLEAWADAQVIMEEDDE